MWILECLEWREILGIFYFAVIFVTFLYAFLPHLLIELKKWSADLIISRILSCAQCTGFYSEPRTLWFLLTINDDYAYYLRKCFSMKKLSWILKKVNDHPRNVKFDRSKTLNRRVFFVDLHNFPDFTNLSHWIIK